MNLDEAINDLRVQVGRQTPERKGAVQAQSAAWQTAKESVQTVATEFAEGFFPSQFALSVTDTELPKVEGFHPEPKGREVVPESAFKHSVKELSDPIWLASMIRKVPAEAANWFLGGVALKPLKPILSKAAGWSPAVKDTAKFIVEKLEGGGRAAKELAHALKGMPGLSRWLAGYGGMAGVAEAAKEGEKNPLNLAIAGLKSAIEDQKWLAVGLVPGVVRGALTKEALPVSRLSKAKTVERLKAASPEAGAAAERELAVRVAPGAPPPVNVPPPVVGRAIEQAEVLRKPVEKPTRFVEGKKEVLRGGEAPRPLIPSLEKTPAGQAINRSVTKWVDDLDPILQAERALGSKPSYTKDPYIRYRLLRGTPGKAKAEIEVGLEPIMRREKNLGEFVDYAKAKHELELAAAYKRQMTPRSLDDARRVINKLETPERQETLRQLVAFQNSTLDRLVDAGVVRRKRADQYKQMYPGYVPFKRDVPDTSILREGSALRAVPQRIKGSTEFEVADVIENVVKNTIGRIELAERNIANQVLVDWARKTPGSAKFMRRAKKLSKEESAQLTRKAEETLPEDISGVFRQGSALGRAGRMIVFRNGKPEAWDFTRAGRDLWDAVKPYTPRERHAAAKVMSALARTLRAGATSFNPDFMVRNIFRDTGQRLVTTGGPSAAVLPDTAKALFEVFKRGDLYREWQRAGGAISGIMGADINTYRRILANAKNRTLAQKVRYAVTHPLETVQTVSQYFEEAPRLAEYARLKGKGVPSMERSMRAAMASRDVSLDFMRSGTRGREWNEIIAFFNAGVQDISKVKRTFQANPARTMARGLLWAAPLTLTEFSMNRNNPDYHNLSSYRKHLFWNLPVFEDKGDFLILPKPFLWGAIFAGGMSEALQYWDDRKDGAEALDGFAGQIATSGIPSLVPQAVDVLLKTVANYDVFRGAPVETEPDLDLEPWMRYDDYTTSGARLIGDVGRGITEGMPDKVGAFDMRALRFALEGAMSPKKVDSVIQSIGGGLGLQLSRAAGSAVGAVVGESPLPDTTKSAVFQIPVIRSLLREGGGYMDVDEVKRFYMNLKESTRAIKTIQESERRDIGGVDTDRRITKADRSAQLRGVATSLSGLYREYRAAESKAEKREVGELITELVREANEEYEKEE